MSYSVTLRFYEELSDFLPRGKRRRDYVVVCAQPRSVKDLIESEGVPHTEVDLILANGASVSFDYPVSEGDRISVYPRFESFDIGAVSRLGRPPLRDTRFVADIHLGSLVRYLRLLGFDCLYPRQADDAALAALSHEQQRILLTRDNGLLKRATVTHGLFLHADKPLAQAREVVRRLQLRESVRLGSRCPVCNGLLDSVAPESVGDELPTDTRRHYAQFSRCRECRKLYWRGAHWKRLASRIAWILAADD